MRKVLLFLLFFLIIMALFLNANRISSFFPSLQENDANRITVYVTPDIYLREQYQREIIPVFDFFAPQGTTSMKLNERWREKNLTFDSLTYSYYGPDEISGKICEDPMGAPIYFILIRGSKIFWHSPENCYLFSNYTIRSRALTPVKLQGANIPYRAGTYIYANDMVVERDGKIGAVRYFYVVKDRFNVDSVVLLLLVNPDVQDESSAFSPLSDLIQDLIISPSDAMSGMPENHHETNAYTEQSLDSGDKNFTPITSWLTLGPFIPDSQSENSYPPEDWNQNWLDAPPAEIAPREGDRIDGKKWEVSNGTYGIVNLGRQYNISKSAYTYAAVYIYSNSSRDVFLRITSDDGEQVWVNGEQVLSRVRVNLSQQKIQTFDTVRGSTLDDIVVMPLENGWNILLVKIYQWKGTWEFFVGLRDLTGNDISDLQMSTQKPEYIQDTESLIFQIGYQDNNASEFSSEWDTDPYYYIGEGFREFPRAVTILDPVTEIHWFIHDPQEFPSYNLTLGLKKANISDSGFVTANISVNGIDIGSFSYPEDWMEKSFPFPPGLMHTGNNTISLQYVEGGDYLVWDYIRLRGGMK